MFVTRSCHGRPQADAGDAHASTKFTDIFCIFCGSLVRTRNAMLLFR